jgi:hypothetical protein
MFIPMHHRKTCSTFSCYLIFFSITTENFCSFEDEAKNKKRGDLFNKGGCNHIFASMYNMKNSLDTNAFYYKINRSETNTVERTKSYLLGLM